MDKRADGRLHVVSTAHIQHGAQLLLDYGPDATKLKVETGFFYRCLRMSLRVETTVRHAE